MEFDDLRTAWQSLDARVEELERSSLALRRHGELARVQRALRWFAASPALGLAQDLVGIGLLAAFLRGGPHEARFVLPALALLACLVPSALTNLWQLAVVGRLDWSAPVLELQRSLARVRAVRVRVVGAIFLLAPLLWMPLLIVAAQGLLGVDVYRVASSEWIAANYLFGLLAIPVLRFAARRVTGRLSSRTLARIVDAISGASLARALSALDEIAGFEMEGPATRTRA